MKINSRFTTCLAYGFTGGPEYNTEITPMDNGGDQRNAQWLYPRHRYVCDITNQPEDARNEALAFFHICMGRNFPFRFKDWNDFNFVDAQNPTQIITPSIGSMTPVQLYKTYWVAGGLYTKQRKITAPIESTIIIRRNGTPVTVTVDDETGLATPSVNWAAGTYTVEGEFDVWVNFDSDYNAFTIQTMSAFSSALELYEHKGLG